MKKKVTINPKNEDAKCFQDAATVKLNYEETEWNPERFSNIKPFINKYNWEGINYPSKIDDWKKFEQNNPTIALNILYIKERNTPRIPNGEKEGWHYLSVKKLSAILQKKLQRVIWIVLIVWIVCLNCLNWIVLIWMFELS